MSEFILSKDGRRLINSAEVAFITKDRDGADIAILRDERELAISAGAIESLGVTYLAANPGFDALEVCDDGDGFGDLSATPVIAWAVSDGAVVPMTGDSELDSDLAGGGVCDNCRLALRQPDGRLRLLFEGLYIRPTVKEWIASLNEKRTPAPPEG